MNMTTATAELSAVSLPPSLPATLASGIFEAAKLLLSRLERGQQVDAGSVRAAMEAAFGASDAAGAWVWKDAYEACEAAQVLFLRRFAPAMRARARSAAAMLAMLGKIAALCPSHTRRSEESRALQQFSTPIELGFVRQCVELRPVHGHCGEGWKVLAGGVPRQDGCDALRRYHP